MKIILLGLLSIGIPLVLQAQEDFISDLEVGFADGVDLPTAGEYGFGYNGTMVIGNVTGDLASLKFKKDLLEQFALVVYRGQDVGGGICSSDVGIISSNRIIPDYVFAADYQLSSLEEMQAYVEEHKHLPGVISQQELEAQGYFMIDKMLFGQLKNLEELLLHTIAQEQKIQDQEARNQRLRERAVALEKRLEALEQQN